MFIKDETHRNYIVTNRLKLSKIMFHIFSQSTNGEEKNSQIESTNICYVIIFTEIIKKESIRSSLLFLLLSMARNKI